MPTRRKIPLAIQEQVRQRAHDLCEYCHTAEKWQYMRFTIDHIIPLVAGGANTLDNLALACFHCNRRKTDKMTGIDSVTSQTVSLFNPRQQVWREHFIWSSELPNAKAVGLQGLNS